MHDYTLYYWPIPFRGHFVRYVLAHVGAAWEEAPVEELLSLKEQEPADQPVPFMAPPLLHDRLAGIHIAQLPAILAYLGKKHALYPGEAEADALTNKIIGDCNDILNEITRYGGEQMWTRESWTAFAAHRLPRWMAIFEETGRRHGLNGSSGHILGSSAPTLADLATAALWFTMTDKLPALAPMLDRTAPRTAALSRRVAATPAIAAMRKEFDARLGNLWCGGEIEKSVRAMLSGA